MSDGVGCEECAKLAMERRGFGRCSYYCLLRGYATADEGIHCGSQSATQTSENRAGQVYPAFETVSD